jgi:hypothetical protein
LTLQAGPALGQANLQPQAQQGQAGPAVQPDAQIMGTPDFTFHIPVQLQDIPDRTASVAVRCSAVSQNGSPVFEQTSPRYDLVEGAFSGTVTVAGNSDGAGFAVRWHCDLRFYGRSGQWTWLGQSDLAEQPESTMSVEGTFTQ